MQAGGHHVIQARPEAPSHPGEPYMKSPSTPSPPVPYPPSDMGSEHVGGGHGNGGTPPASTPTSSAVIADLPHAERVAAANRVRAKAWPLVGRNWYPAYHLAAYAGWMSVPGGLCVHNNAYHVFYQHHPFSENWGPMHWGHCVSTDLVHWQHLPVALAPGEPYDRDGCFSGSAVSHEGKLYIFYTGHTWGCSTNVENEGIYQQQCLAVSEDDGVTFTKLGPIIRPPPEYIHFRDPKVWRQDGRWWMVLGARDVSKDVGQLLLFSSENLEEWDETAYRVVSRAQDKNVFMWECPDFFPVASVTFREAGYTHLGHGSLLHANERPMTFEGGSNALTSSGVGSASAGNSFCEGGGGRQDRGARGSLSGPHSAASSSMVSTASSSVCASVAGTLASSDFVLVYCPQGMMPQGTRYRNRFQSGYLTGHWGVKGRCGDGSAGSGGGLSVHGSHRAVHGATRGGHKGMRTASAQRKEFEITQHFKELDHGHDFYAPQTFVAPDGRRILIGWLDMWESPMPSKEFGWSGMLTIPRELTYDCTTQKVTMRPVREMALLRVAVASVPAQVICENGELPLVEDCSAFEISLTFNLDNSTGEKFGLWLGHGAEVYYDAQTSSIVVNRHYPVYMLSGYRSCELNSVVSGTLLHLHVFIDRSSLEVFVNDGALTMSSRIYPHEEGRALRLFSVGGVADLVEGSVWKLDSNAVRH